MFYEFCGFRYVDFGFNELSALPLWNMIRYQIFIFISRQTKNRTFRTSNRIFFANKQNWKNHRSPQKEISYIQSHKLIKVQTKISNLGWKKKNLLYGLFTISRISFVECLWKNKQFSLAEASPYQIIHVEKRYLGGKI